MNRSTLSSALRSLIGLAGLLAILMATSAAGQDAAPLPLRQDGETLVLETHAHRLVLPLPDWLTNGERAGETLPLVETMFSSSERQAVLTITPKGETPETWRTLYAARLTLEPDRTLIDYRRSTMTGYARNCRPELTGFFQLGEDRGETLAPLGFVCGAFLERLGNLVGMGEVAIISFKRTPAGVASIYQEWRGDAFDPTNPAAWPVPTDVVELRARQLQDEAELIATGD